MRLYFIRHGQSGNNALGNIEDFQIKRSYDPDLTTVGVLQAQAAADYLAQADDTPLPQAEKFGITRLYSSAMIRALETARPISAALGLPVDVWVDLHETGGLFLEDAAGQVKGFGGLTCEQFQARFPAYRLPPDVTDSGWWDIASGREEPDQYMARAIRVASQLYQFAETSERIAIVSHAGFLDKLLKAFLNQLPSFTTNLFYGHYNTGISRLDFYEGMDDFRIHYLNRLNHLPAHLWTW